MALRSVRPKPRPRRLLLLLLGAVIAIVMLLATSQGMTSSGKLQSAAASGGECAALDRQLADTQQQLAKVQQRVRELETALPQQQTGIKAAQHQHQEATVDTQGTAVAKTLPLAGSSSQRPTAGSRGPFDLETLDLGSLLGPLGVSGGVMYKPFMCLPPWSLAIKDETLLNEMKTALVNALVQTVSRLVTNTSADVATAPFMSLVGLSPSDPRSVDSPHFVDLNSQLSTVLSRFLLYESGVRVCACGSPATGANLPVVSASGVGTTRCAEGVEEPEDAGFACVGGLSGVLLGTNWGVEQLAHAVATTGFCTNELFANSSSFATWWMQNRLYAPKYRNFDVKQAQEDVILELFDIIYENNHVFQKQKWMGFTMMQDPFDLLAIQNLLYDVKPSLLIETGTANGGSALLWASIFEVLGLENSRIHTIDANDPVKGFGSRDGAGDPTQHRLWKKYITFHKGLSSDPKIMEAIAAAAAAAPTVVALLDSDHSADNVANELRLYCERFVTVGSYCIVEDTKLSRMGSAPGPLGAVWDFLANATKAIKWEVDRGRELMYSQHVMGYLKRTA